MVKSVRFERLLASTAFGLILALSSHAGMAQQSEQKIEAAIAAPDSSQAPSVSTRWSPSRTSSKPFLTTCVQERSNMTRRW